LNTCTPYVGPQCITLKICMTLCNTLRSCIILCITLKICITLFRIQKSSITLCIALNICITLCRTQMYYLENLHHSVYDP
jgi:hypothetical protein